MRRTAVICACVGTAGFSAAATAHAQKPPKPPKPPQGGNAVSLAATPNPVRFGSYVTLSGRLTGNDHAGKAVTLSEDPFPFALFVPKGTKTTAANGNFSFAESPSVTTRYRVVAASSPPVTSPVVTVSVAYRVGLSVSDSTPRRGTRVRFSGSVGPRKDGATAFIQKRRSDGRFVTVARTTLRAATATRSAYSRRLLINRDGTYRVRVSGDASHVAGVSRTRTLRVH